MRWALLVLAGCGRLGFTFGDAAADAPDDGAADARSIDAPPGHDEDLDGVVDSADNCPCTANPTQADADADGVGDACDPHPATAGDARALFVSFAVDQGPFTFASGPLSVQNDALQFDATTQYVELSAPLAIHAGSVILVGHIATAPNVARQIAIGLFTSTSSPHNYVELYSDSNVQYIGVSAFDGTSFFAVQTMAMANPVHTGDVTLGLTAAATTWQTTGGWPGESYMAAGSASYFGAETKLDLGFNGITGSVLAICAVTSP